MAKSSYTQWGCIKCQGTIDPAIKETAWGKSMISCPHCGNVIKPMLVSGMDEIIANMREFQRITADSKCHAYRYFSSFRHWYFLPQEGIFAPSKFVEYQNATIKGYGINTYRGHGATDKKKNGKGCFAQDGRETEPLLKKWFFMLDKSTEEFNILFLQLEQFARKLNRSLHPSIQSEEGRGGIHIPHS